jgi:hypothetical protein
MKKSTFQIIALLLGLMIFAQAIQAQITIYTASLSGAAEAPPNASLGTGSATITINSTLNTMRVQCTFSGLTGTTTATHIHATTAVANTGTAGVATQTPSFTGFPSGVTSGTYDQTFDMTLASSYNPTFVTASGGTPAAAFAALQAAADAGKAYFNIHTSTFPAGEIRGFLTKICSSSGIAYVNTTVASSGDGTTWTTAFKTLQEALTVANSCPIVTQIWVAKGTYYPTADESGNTSPANPRTKTFVMKNNIAIYGGFVGNEASNYDLSLRNFVTNETILSGDIDQNNTLDNNNAYNVVVNINTNNTAILDGFTVTGGYADSDIGYPDRRARGAAMYNNTSSPTIRNCIFSNNLAVYGIAYNVVSSPTFTNCVFVQNQSTAFWNEAGGTTGLINCTLSANASMIVNGGGTNTLVKNSIFWGNGGGISNTVTITNSIVQGGYTGTGNLNQDPLFVNQPTYGSGATGDLRLLACSPAIDKGDDTDNNATNDVSGNPRKFESIAGGSLIDMGAYERQQLTYSGTILYVNQAVSSSGDGTTWATAFKTLQEAIQLSCPNVTQIWVAKGTYYPTADETRNFSPTDVRTKTFLMKNNIAIYGGFLGNEASNYDLSLRNFTANETILSGDIDQNNTLDNNNAYNVVVNVNTDNTAILDGFTVTGGYYGPDPGFPLRKARGSAMYNYSSSPTIRNCIFSKNVGFYGNTYNLTSSATFTNCVFVQNDNNAAFNEGGGTTSYINCTFAANARAINTNSGTNTIVKNSIIWGNTDGIGGDVSGVTVTNSIVQGGFMGTGNLNQDPLFVNQPTLGSGATGDLRLLACSRAINAGDNTGAPAKDLDGNLRPYVGTASITDMGAYEFQGNPIVINAPTVTQPTCALPTGTIVVNASGTGTLEYSINNGTNWQPSATFSGLSAGNYTIKVRTQGSPSCEVIYGSNPVVLNSPFTVTATDTWTGCVSTDWATPGNWQDGSVPTATDDVNIPNVVNDPVIGAGTAAVAKSVLVNTGAILTINATGSLAINGSISPRHGLDNYGILDNSGTIRVGNTTAVGAIGIVQRNGGTFNNKTGGAIYIDRTGGAQAFYTSGVVNNEATIEIGSTAAVTGQGLYIESGTGIFNNKTGSLLTINNSTVWGMENKGTLDNSGTIRVGNIASAGAICIVHRSGGTFNNKTGGAIYMDRTTAGGQAFYSSGLVNNQGAINIGSNADLNGEGIRIEGNIFNNEALIEIGSQSDVKRYGIINFSTFNNKAGGEIRINRIGILNTNVIGAIRNQGIFTNDAMITIGNIGLVRAQDGISNVGNFTNNVTGVISIAKPWGNGIWHSNGTFQNAGKITIRNVFNANNGNFSTGILSTGPFSNTTGAEIHIDHVANGIASTRAFTNAGLIRMGENGPLTGSGIANIQGVNAVFNNNAGGDISIKQTEVDGVQNDALSTFNNNACAKLTIFDNLNNAGTFTNAGLFTVNTTQAHTNTGTVTNNGIIEYPQGNPIPNVTNNDVIVAPIFICGTAINPALQIGGMNSFNVGTTWYKEPSLTNAAGTYSPNTFTVANLVAGNTYPLYFEITDPTNMCTRTVSISAAVNVPPIVSTPQTTLCTGLTMTLSPTSGGTWQTSNLSMASVTNEGLVTALVPGVVYFTFTSDATKCSATTANVTIKQTPTSNLTASKVDVCANTEVTLNPNCSIPTSTVNWNPGGPTVTPAAATLPYVYRARCVADGCVGNESSVEVRTHRILVDMKDLDVGALPLPIVRSVIDNMKPTNQVNAPVFPRRWTFIANGCDASESAEFKLSGPVLFNAIDNTSTYALFANEGNSFYSIDHSNYGNGGSFPNGTYSLTIDLRSQDGVGGPFPKNRVATGALLATRTLQFTVSSPQSIVGGRQSVVGSEQWVVSNGQFAEVAPNPVSNTMRLKISEAKGQKVGVSLMDASGRMMMQRNFIPETNQHQEEFEVDDLASGMYFLRVNTENKNATIKVVKVE